MIVVFRLLYSCAALLSIAAGALVVASHFIADRAPQSTHFLGIHLAVGATFLGLGVLFLGIRRNVAGVAALVCGDAGAQAPELATHVNRLLAYLLAGGAFLCAVLVVIVSAIVKRIGQGFAVFG